MVIDEYAKARTASTLRSLRGNSPFESQGDLDIVGDFLWDTLGMPSEPARGLHWSEDDLADMCEMLAALIEL